MLCSGQNEGSQLVGAYCCETPTVQAFYSHFRISLHLLENLLHIGTIVSLSVYIMPRAVHNTGILEVLHCVLVESPEALNIIKEGHIKSIISLLDKHGRNHKV